MARPTYTIRRKRGTGRFYVSGGNLNTSSVIGWDRIEDAIAYRDALLCRYAISMGLGYRAPSFKGAV